MRVIEFKPSDVLAEIIGDVRCSQIQALPRVVRCQRRRRGSRAWAGSWRRGFRG
jgi:hypothetical protein